MHLENNHPSFAIGVDVGGTKIACGIVDSLGNIYAHQEIATKVQEGAKAVEEQILTEIRTLLKQTEFPILGIGIGAAGQVDAQTGNILFAPNLYWHNVPLCTNLQKALQLPIHGLNDVRASTLAEWHFGAGKGCRDLLCIFVGTGIGGGIISENILLKGNSNTCGEIGHMTIDLHGPFCTCGKRGCFEALAGGWAIATKARAIVESEDEGELCHLLLNLVDGKPERINAKTVITGYLQEDPLCITLMTDVLEALVIGLSNLVNICNPRKIILGGGIIEGFTESIPYIEEKIKQTALKASTGHLEIAKAHFGREAGVIGAATAILLKERE